MRTLFPRPGAARVLLASCLLALAAGPAFAYDGFTVGLGSALPLRDAPALNARALYPFLGFTHGAEELQVSARADVSYALGIDGFPALALSALLSSGSGDAPIERYLGVGGGLAFTGPGLNGATGSLVVFSGLRAPLVAGLHAFAEAFLAATPHLVAPTFGFGLEYTFGATR